MSEKKWNIKGFVVDSQSKKGLSGLHVEAWDKDKSRDDPLDSMPTDDKGFFQLEFDESRFKEHESDKLSVYLVIRHNGKEIEQTGIIHPNLEPGVTDWGHIMVNLAEEDVTEEEPPEEEKESNLRTVNGRIQWSYRQSVPNVPVTLFDQGMDAATTIELGQAQTNDQGRYTITYDPTKLGAGKTKGDLYIQVNHNGSTVTTKDKTRWNANDRETIDLTIEGQEPTEYQRLVSQLTPILAAQNKNVTDLEKTHIDYLAKKTKLTAIHIGYYVDASKLAGQIRQYISQIQTGATLPESEDGQRELAKQTGIAVAQIQALKSKLPRNPGKSITSDKLDAIPEILYGLWRENMPASLIDLLAKGVGTLQDALIAAKEKNIINQDGAWLTDYHSQLAAWAAVHTTSQQKSDFATYLDPINLGDARARVAILQTFATRGSLPDKEDDFWEQDSLKSIDQRTQSALQSVYSFEPNGRFLPLVKAIQDNGLTIANKRTLAMYDAAEWNQYLIVADESEPDVAKRNEFVQSLITEVRKQYPTVLLGTELRKPPVLENFDLLKEVLQGRDPEKPLPTDFEWPEDFGDEQINAVKSELAKVHQEIARFPAFKSQFISQIANGATKFENPLRSEVANFLRDNVDFELDKTTIDDYPSLNPDNDPISQKPLKEQLKRHQRVFAFAPEGKQMDAVMGLGIHSAHNMMRLPRKTFQRRYAQMFITPEDQELAKKEALQIYGRAKHIASRNLVNYTNYALAANDVRPFVLGESKAQKQKTARSQNGQEESGEPDWEGLFGPLPSCDYPEWRTVYSPAAYYVDLLEFLKPVKEDSDSNPQAVLFNRRPDLKNLELSEANTNTMLPYIDLVNEVLEYYVAEGNFGDETVWNTSEKVTSEQLDVVPENYPLPRGHEESAEVAYTSKAYEKVKTAVYPFALPYDADTAVIRTYLKQLNSSPFEIMWANQGLAKTDNDNPWNLELALAQLNLSLAEKKILSGEEEPDLSKYFGYERQGDWLDNITKVKVFLKRTGLTYKEVATLFKTQFINPDETISLDSSCDLETAKISNLSADALHRIYRFIRLWRKLNWPIEDTDKVISRLSNPSLSFELWRKTFNYLEEWVQGTIDWSGLLSEKILHDKQGKLIVELEQIFPRFGWTKNYVKQLLTVENDRQKQAHFKQLFSNLTSIQIGSDCEEQLYKTYSDLETLFRQSPISNPEVTKLVVPSLVSCMPFDSDESIWNMVLMKLPLPSEDLVNPSQSSIPPINKQLLKRLEYQTTDFGKNVLLLLLEVIFSYELDEEQKYELIQFVDVINGKLKSYNYETILIRLAQFKHLHTKLSLSITSLLNFWYSIDTYGEQAHYTKLFQNSTIQSPDDIDKFKLNEIGDELSNTENKIIDNQQVIAAALQIDTTDFNRLYTNLSTQNGDANLKLDLANLSAFYRHAQLARALKLTITELLTVKKLVDTIPVSNPFDSNDLGGAINFIETVRKIKDSPFTIPQLAYMFFKQADDAQSVQLSEQAKNTLKDKLLEGFEIEGVKDNGTNDETYLTKTQNAHIERILNEEFNAGIELTTLLLTKLNWSNDPVISVGEFIRSKLVDLKKENSPEGLQPAITFLHKCTLLLNTFKLSKQEVKHLIDRKDDFDGFSLEALNDTNNDAVPFKLWQRLFDLCQLRDSLPQNHTSLLDIFEKTIGESTELNQELIDSVADLFSWNKGDLANLIKEKLQLDKGDFRNEIKLVALQRCLTMAKRFGVTAVQLYDWNSNLKNDQNLIKTSQEMVSAVKAKYDDKTWLKVAEPLNDHLREQRRDALVTYILHHDDKVKNKYEDVNDLLGYFLIDVAMSACMPTTRLVQATAAVQLFVQRCFMSLEKPEVSPDAFDDDQRERWRWLKNYRKWELNQKVFLYPENVLRPELRKDKSPFFADLEQELLQNELTEENIETAVRHYLEKLNEIANLVIRSMYWEESTDDKPAILHVFGRTTGEPHIYYYRCWINRSSWTPWEKVDLDIEGDHLIPIVFHGRLYIFWALFGEEKRNDKQLKTREIKLAWSRYHSGSWSPKKVSPLSLQSIPLAQDFSISLTSNTMDLYSSLFEFFQEHDFQCTWNSVIVFPGTPNLFTDRKSTVEFTLHIQPPNKISDHYFRIENEAEDVEIVCYKKTPKEPPNFKIMNLKLNDFDPDCRRIGVFRFSDWQEEITVSENKNGSIDPDSAPRNPHYDDHLCPHQDTVFEGIFQFDPTPNIESEFPSLYAKPRNIDSVKQHRIRNWEASRLMRALIRNGVDGLFDDDVRLFNPQFVEDLQAAPAMYRWEVFFHIPIYFALQLNVNQQFAAAQKWIHRIFDPTASRSDSAESPWWSQYWRFDPFQYRNAFATSEEILLKWQEDPFDPHVVAQLRQEAYKKQVVMLYIDNLLDWGDHLFSQFTRESVNEAIQLYALAYEVLGSSPQSIEAGKYIPGGLLVKDFRTDHFTEEISCYVSPSLDYSPSIEIDFDFQTGTFTITDNTYTGAYSFLAEGKLKLERNGSHTFNVVLHENSSAQLYINNQIIIDSTTGVLEKSIDLEAGLWNVQFKYSSPEGSPIWRWLLLDNIESGELELINPSYYLTDFLRTHEDLSRLFASLDAIENGYFSTSQTGRNSTHTNRVEDAGVLINSMALKGIFFGVPQNQKLFAYWKHVADRLFKIRHCQDIHGVKRALALFAPPLDMAQLGQIGQMGASALDLTVDPLLPHYRFQFVLQKALEFCNDVKALGNTLLSALEKRDAEKISLMRSGHEKQLLKAVKEIKNQQLREAESALENLLRGKDITQERFNYYSTIQYMNELEQTHLQLMETSLNLQIAQALISYYGNVASLIPDTKIGAPFTMGVTVGGSTIGQALQAYASYLGSLASISSTSASMSATLGGYERRKNEWDLQAKLAEKELKQIDEQIKAANIRIEIAKKELQNHETQIKHAEEVGEFLQDKFTNAELYSWMSGQISTLYFQSYQMALTLARQAQKAFEHELGLETQNFIQPNHWDSLRKGLLAGDHLYKDLKKMELAYIENNKRLHELTKNISLALLHPEALIMLHETGSCHFNLPEAIFDLDHPGHYMRRIKSVSLSIPCVTGPYTSVSATLTLDTSRIRNSADTNGGYPEKTDSSDPRFIPGNAHVTSIATSSAQNDSGLFELNFHDERYLPFEGAGAISQWKLELPNEFRQFNYDTISDVILHVRYTAKEGDDTFKRTVEDALAQSFEAMAVETDKQQFEM